MSVLLSVAGAPRECYYSAVGLALRVCPPGMPCGPPSVIVRRSTRTDVLVVGAMRLIALRFLAAREPRGTQSMGARLSYTTHPSRCSGPPFGCRSGGLGGESASE